MPNWTSITADDLKAEGFGVIVDRARTVSVGGTDPVEAAIANAVAKVRRAVMVGNTLDTDPAKVPGSLKELTMMSAMRTLKRRLQLALSEDERRQREEDNAELKRLAELKIRVEPADSPDTSGAITPNNHGAWNSERKIVGRTHAAPAPGLQFPPSGGYANPTGPADSAI